MHQKYLKIAFISFFIMGFTTLVSCKKNDDLKTKIEELAGRVTNIENQLTQINKDLNALQQQGKLNADETNSLKSLTANLSTLTTDIKNNTSLNSKNIDALKESLKEAITTVQFDALKLTISQLNELVNSNYLGQQITDQNTNKLNILITQIGVDLETLKAKDAGKLDRPINFKVSKGNYGHLVISWTPMPLATNYQLYRLNQSKGQYEMINESADTTFTDPANFEANMRIFYKVKIVNSSNAFSDFSDVDYGFTLGIPYEKYFSFDYRGTTPGLYGYPQQLTVDAENNIYVSNYFNSSIQKFDRLGKFQEVFYNGFDAGAIAFQKNGNALVSINQRNSNGNVIQSSVKIINTQKSVIKEVSITDNTKPGSIIEVTVDEENNFYVAVSYGTDDGLISKFDQNGNLLSKFEVPIMINGNAEKASIGGMCFLNGKLFIVSNSGKYGKTAVNIFNKQDGYVSSWDAGVTPCAYIKASGNSLFIHAKDRIIKTDEKGTIKQKIITLSNSNIMPNGLAVNSDGEVIYSDFNTSSVIVYK